MAVEPQMTIETIETVQTVTQEPRVQLLIDPSDGTQLVSVNEAAKLMAVSRRTVYYWISRGMVEIRESPSGKLYIEVASLWKSADRGGSER